MYLIQTLKSLWSLQYSFSGPVAMFLCHKIAASMLLNALFFKALIPEISVIISLHKTSPVNDPATLLMEKGTFGTSPSSAIALINTVFNSLTYCEVALCIIPKSPQSSNIRYGLPLLLSF